MAEKRKIRSHYKIRSHSRIYPKRIRLIRTEQLCCK